MLFRKNDSTPIFAIESSQKKQHFPKKKNKIKGVELNYFSVTPQEENVDFLGKSLAENKSKNLFLLIVLFLLILLAKSFYLQILQGDKYYELAEKNRIRINIIRSMRGLIYDRQRLPLVKNIPNFSLAIIPSELPINETKKDEILANIAQISKITLEEIKQILEPIKKDSLYFYQPITIKENLTYEESILLNIKYANYRSVIINTDGRRQYTNSYENNPVLSLSHLLGYVGKLTQEELINIDKNKTNYLLNDYIGKIGLEKYYENMLRGQYGQIKTEVDAYGNEKNLLSKQEKISGKNLILSLDLKMQSFLEKSLTTHLKKLNLARGSIIALNPNNGQILALVSLPAFDNNDFAKGISQENFQKLLENPNQPLFNRTVSGNYPCGSPFKIIMAAAALEEKIINVFSTVNSTGGIYYGKWFFPDWNLGGHGITNVYKALAWSVNTFFYALGGGYQQIEGLELNKIAEYAAYFGLGKKTGIDLPNEASGFLPSEAWKIDTKNEPWYIGDTYHLAIGQGDLLVTPLQVANFTAVIANKGTLFRPYLVTEIENPDTKETQTILPQILSQNFVSSDKLNIVAEGMRQAVTVGSARFLADLPLKIAGKTGTAQWHSEKNTHAWFTSFAPYDTPQIVLTILIEEGGEGSSIAVPIAKEFYAWWQKEYQP